MVIMIKMDHSTFVYSIYIETTLEQLWDALTKGEITCQYWYGRRIDSDWKISSPVTIWLNYGQDIDMSGKVLEYQPLHRLSFSWNTHTDTGSKQDSPSRVIFDLESLGSVIKCTVTHDELQAGDMPSVGISEGWPIIMCSLKSFLETGKPLSITSNS